MLADMPARCPVMPEADELGHPEWPLLSGKRTGLYRTSSTSQEVFKQKPHVRVLRIWYGTRDRITAEDMATE